MSISVILIVISALLITPAMDKLQYSRETLLSLQPATAQFIHEDRLLIDRLLKPRRKCRAGSRVQALVDNQCKLQALTACLRFRSRITLAKKIKREGDRETKGKTR